MKNDINIYAIHTNLDNNPKGVNYKIAKRLSLKNTSLLLKKDNNEFGMGMIGELNDELSEIEFFEFLKLKMNVKHIKHSPLLGKKIKKIAGFRRFWKFCYRRSNSSKGRLLCNS